MEAVNSLTKTGVELAEIKMCCAAAYQSEWATWLLGESFHPGGVALTEHLGRTLGLTPNMRVLDVAAGKGTSAIYLAQTFSVASRPAILPASLVAWRWASLKYAGTVMTASVTRSPR